MLLSDRPMPVDNDLLAIGAWADDDKRKEPYEQHLELATDDHHPAICSSDIKNARRSGQSHGDWHHTIGEELRRRDLKNGSNVIRAPQLIEQQEAFVKPLVSLYAMECLFAQPSPYLPLEGHEGAEHTIP